MTNIRRAFVILIGTGAFAGCAKDPAVFGDRQIGPISDVAEIRTYERRVWEHGVIQQRGTHLPTGIVVDGDIVPLPKEYLAMCPAKITHP